MKIGNLVMIINHPELEGKAAEVAAVDGTNITVKVFKTGESVVLSEENLKRKKVCVCGDSAAFPFCDGSHSRG
jgi:CDGSH-type Zn-finger protein